MDFLDRIPRPVLTVLAAVGFVAIAKPIVNYIRLFLSLFVLRGKNVSPLPIQSEVL